MDIQNLTERGALMQRNLDETSAMRSLHRLRNLIPKEELYSKLSQDGCELEEDFLGFLNTYEAVSRFVPTKMIIVDFGCYMAAQAYFFKNHRRYIGVDFYELGEFSHLERFETSNSIMLKQSIQEAARILPSEYYAVCSAVNDASARKIISRKYPNHCIRYPNLPDDIAGIGAKEIGDFIYNGRK